MELKLYEFQVHNSASKYFHHTQTEIKTANAQRQHLQSEKEVLEQELAKSQETVDDLQLEVQQARMIPTGPTENIEGQGNSLFSEVEDQRKKTASELNILTSTYKDKITKFDSMEAEIETLRNQNTNLKFQLSSMVVSGKNFQIHSIFSYILVILCYGFKLIF